jgi:cyclic-di-AMP phosphodiesterase PgpH
MIKQGTKNKIKLIVWSILIVLISFILKANLAVALFLICLYMYTKCRRISLGDFKLPNISLLFLIIFSASYFLIKHNWQNYYIPFSLIPMLSILLFNNLEISFLITLATSVSCASLSNTPFQLFLLCLISGIFSIILVNEARKRSTIIRAGFIVGAIQVVSLVLIERLWIGLPERYLILFSNGIVSSMIVLGVLPLFEYLFKTFTNISLLELADFHHPLLQRLILEAPGTYHHSLMVGNLCENACQVVGANALLARIGAYYHDIGKLSKPEYFSENQSVKESKHDALSPAMSKLIIMNHVKEGEDLAKKYRLNPALIDFIQQHHGTGLVYYFYRRALENLE